MPLKLHHAHSWNVEPAAARAIQDRLRDLVIRRDEVGPVRRIGGIDVGFEQGGDVTRAAAVVLSFPELETVDQAVVRQATSFPYVPGLLSFREIPAVLQALEGLRLLPDLLLCDGQGYAHPRRFGLACHLGVLTGIPCIGAAKSRLIGSHGPLPDARGSRVFLQDRSETIGMVVRTRTRVTPLYISPGHRIGLDSAVEYVLACCQRYRLPETTRRAHRLASGE